MLITLCVITLVSCVASRSPPRALTNEPQGEIRVKAGQAVRLHCSVDADPPALLQWTKDDEGIHSGWERFKVGQGSLRIKDVTEDDSGHYVCRATNGFGSVNIEHDLYVITDNNGTSVTADDGNNDGPIMAPQFTNPEQMQPMVNQPEGSTVRLKCKAHGQPRPTVTWYHNNRLIPGESQPSWMLKLGDVREENSGKYTCRVTNKGGSVNFTYVLEVVTRLSKPILTSPHPMNTTALYGDTAVLQCVVNSDVEPTIQWLKRLDDPNDVRVTNNTFRVNGHEYMVLSQGATQMMKSDGTYLNKLTLRDVTESDAGLYVCWGGNSAGYNTREAYLSVTRGGDRSIISFNQPTTRASQQLPLWVIVAALIGVVAIVVIIILAMLCKRKKSHRSPRSQSTPTRNVSQVPFRNGDAINRQYQHDYAKLQGPIYHYPVQTNASRYPDSNTGRYPDSNGGRYPDQPPALPPMLINTTGRGERSFSDASQKHVPQQPAPFTDRKSVV